MTIFHASAYLSLQYAYMPPIRILTTSHMVTYHFQQWISRLSRSQATRWLQAHVPRPEAERLGLIGRVAYVLRQHSLSRLQGMISQQWVDLVFVLYHRTLTLMVRPQLTFGKLKKIIMEFTPESTEQFVIQNFGDNYYWEECWAQVYPDEQTVADGGLQTSELGGNYYLFCRQQLTPRANRAMVRERLRLLDCDATAEMQRWCRRPPSPPAVIFAGLGDRPLSANSNLTNDSPIQESELTSHSDDGITDSLSSNE
jgi:hypothetical protein